MDAELSAAVERVFGIAQAAAAKQARVSPERFHLCIRAGEPIAVMRLRRILEGVCSMMVETYPTGGTASIQTCCLGIVEALEERGRVNFPRA